MTDTLVQNIVNAFSGSMPKELIVFIISMIPVLELRGSILAAGFLKMNFLSTYIIAVIGNMIPIPFILLFIDKIFDFLRKTRFKPMVEKFEKRALSKSDQIKKYGKFGLFLFVAIPLPGTGAWTGSLIAALLGIKFKKAFPAVIIGILMATVIMWFVSYVLLGGVHLLG